MDERANRMIIFQMNHKVAIDIQKFIFNLIWINLAEKTDVQEVTNVKQIVLDELFDQIRPYPFNSIQFILQQLKGMSNGR